MKHLPQRQVNLDFHTSPLIPDVGTEFDAREFARTLQRAHVNSVTIFAKCHHGMCYYPTKTGTPHPALNGRDLLGEQIEALHRVGIRCPIYTTIAWEEDVAYRHPEWRQVRVDGTFARSGTVSFAWWFNNWLHPDYQDYIEAHVRELLDRYDVDGLFFDIVFFDSQSCWSDVSRKFRVKHALLDEEPATQARFQDLAQTQFTRRFARLVRGVRPQASFFFNGTNALFADSRLGSRTRPDTATHYEIESLPTGLWGYHHFPRQARHFAHWGKPWIGVTGRFQKSWGDFGGIKPQAALEYECFRSQALGGGNSVGDQLPPRGTLDPAAYELIGAVYAQCAAAEPFYAGSTALPQVGIIVPDDDKSTEGAVLMCEETHYDCAMLDDASDLTGFDLVMLPDTVTITPKLTQKLRAYYRGGGKLLASHRALPGFLPVRVVGETEKFPTYWRTGLSDRVFYEPGLNIVPGTGVSVLVKRVLPYFQRTDEHFSSHAQTPPIAHTDRYPAVVAGKNFVYFADPIFREYRQSGNLAARDEWRRAIERLIGAPPFGAGLPTTVLVYPCRRGRNLLLTLLHYAPVRKALEIDVCEERLSFAGEHLNLPPTARTVRVFDTGESLPANSAGSFMLPLSKGRLLLEVPNFFRV
jgi:putative glycosyl hydrolase-like family 6 (GHL6) protein